MASAGIENRYKKAAAKNSSNLIQITKIEINCFLTSSDSINFIVG